MLNHTESIGLIAYTGTPPKRQRGERSPDHESVPPPKPSPDPDGWRLTTTAWCSCKRCGVMPTSRECVCCRDCPPAVATQPEGCVTEHADFAPICLQPGVLNVAFWALEEAGLHPSPGEPIAQMQNAEATTPSLEKFETYCTPRCNETYECYVFRSRMQKEAFPSKSPQCKSSSKPSEETSPRGTRNRTSRRIKGEDPEYGSLLDKLKPKTTTMANQSQTPAAPAFIYLPVAPRTPTNTTSTAIRVIADHVNLPPRSSVFVTVITNPAMHGEALLEGSVQLLLEKGIGVARGVTDLQEGRHNCSCDKLPRGAAAPNEGYHCGPH
ncbi:uncharacterized protein ISCGN_026465 [Ixodes scapularis]